MARPRIATDTKRSKRFIFRLSESELATLVEAANVCGTSAGALVREKLFKGKFPKAATAKLDVLHYAELKKIGVNLNQLTRLCHSGRMPRELLGVLLRLEQRLNTTIAKLINDSYTKDR